MDALSYNRGRKYSTQDIGEIQRIVGVETSGEWNQITVDAVIEFQRDHELQPDGKVGPGTLAAIRAADVVDDDHDDDRDDADAPAAAPTRADSKPAPARADSETPPARSEGAPLEALREWCSANTFELVDYRDLKAWPRKKTYTKDYGYPLDKSRADPPKGGIRRDWTSITTFMLHTTAVSGMTKKRGVGIPCHFYLPKEDAVVLCHELELLIYHGHAGNKFSVGLEISGVSDWDSPTQLERGKALIRYFQAVRRMHVGEDAKCYIMAHRQSHESRVKDPGKAIWRDLGEWAIEELGFELGPVVGSGKPIDPTWRERT